MNMSIYINDLNKAIKFCKTYHFADDTYLLFVDKSMKKIQNLLTLIWSSFANGKKGNKISLNTSKTELIIFRDPRRKISYELKIKIDGKKLIPSKFVKCLGVFIDCHFNWQIHLMELRTKLSRAVGCYAKLGTMWNSKLSSVFIMAFSFHLWLMVVRYEVSIIL